MTSTDKLTDFDCGSCVISRVAPSPMIILRYSSGSIISKTNYLMKLLSYLIQTVISNSLLADMHVWTILKRVRPFSMNCIGHRGDTFDFASFPAELHGTQCFFCYKASSWGESFSAEGFLYRGFASFSDSIVTTYYNKSFFSYTEQFGTLVQNEKKNILKIRIIRN